MSRFLKSPADDVWMTLVPAYGRDYKSREDVLKAWTDGKDFTIRDISWPDNGRYVNVGDAENPELADRNGNCLAKLRMTFKIRYARLSRFCLVKKVNGQWIALADDDSLETK